MVKFRQAGYCNLKLLLLLMVVYGHWIENRIDSSEILMGQYRLIYFVHMPLFVFLSGLFLRNGADCVRQIKRLLPLYLILQAAAVGVSGGAGGIRTPFWHLWYLLSFCWWTVAGWLWFRFFEDKSGGIRGHLWTKAEPGDLPPKMRQATVLAGTMLVGVLAGFAPWLDRTLSGSRTVVFFPYFLAGLMCKVDVHWEKYRKWGVAALGAALLMIAVWGKEIPASFLYHAEPYDLVGQGIMKQNIATQDTAAQEAIRRLLCYAISSLLGFFLLTAIPHKRFPFTRAGADTMPAYLIHAPMVGVLREFSLPWGTCLAGSVFLLYIIYKIFQWRSPLYGIVAIEGRDKSWPLFKRFMKNTGKVYTDSFWP